MRLRCVIQLILIDQRTNSFTFLSIKLHFNKSTLTFGLVLGWAAVSWVEVLFVWPIHPPCILPVGRSWCLTASPDVGVASGCIYFHRTWTENSSLSHVPHTVWKSKVELFVHRMKWKGCFVIVQHKKSVLNERNRSVNVSTRHKTSELYKEKRFLNISNKTFTDPNMRCWTEPKGETYRNRVSTLENAPLNIYELINTLLAYSFTLIHPKQDVS